MAAAELEILGVSANGGVFDAAGAGRGDGNCVDAAKDGGATLPKTKRLGKCGGRAAGYVCLRKDFSSKRTRARAGVKDSDGTT